LELEQLEVEQHLVLLLLVLIVQLQVELMEKTPMVLVELILEEMELVEI